MVYYGVSFSTPTLGGNMYLNFFLASIIEIPANYAGIWAMGRWVAPVRQRFWREISLKLIYFFIRAIFHSIVEK